MTDEKSNSSISIEQLYSNRKQQHPMPESLKAAIDESLRKSLAKSSDRKKSQHFRYMTPFALASVLAVIFIWPSKSILYSPESVSSVERASNQTSLPKLLSQGEDLSLVREERMMPPAVEAEPQPQVAITPNAVNDLNVDEEFEARRDPVFYSTSDQNIEVPASILAENTTKGSIDGLAEADVQSEEVTESTVLNTITSAAPLASESSTLRSNVETMKQPSEYQDHTKESKAQNDMVYQEISADPVIVRVLNGDKGQFENCDGELIHMAVKTDLIGWVTITMEPDENYSIKPNDKFECSK